jgi:hypothetical protein
MEIKIIPLEQALYILAAVITVASAMLTLVAHSLRKTKDPFLPFYVISIIGISFIYWMIIAWNFGPAQIEMVQYMYGLFAVAGLVTVAWRSVLLHYFNKNPSKTGRPYGFKHQHTNFRPYFLLIIPWVLMTLWLTLYFTFDDVNAPNRQPLIFYFVGFLVFCIVCRFLWEWIESRAIDKCPYEKSIRGVLCAVDLDHESVIIKTDNDKRVQITEVPEESSCHIAILLNSTVIVEADLDEGGPYRFRSIRAPEKK